MRERVAEGSDPPPPAFAASLNRAQRRAAQAHERKRRKRALHTAAAMALRARGVEPDREARLRVVARMREIDGEAT
jgi:hypothetical protein